LSAQSRPWWVYLIVRGISPDHIVESPEHLSDAGLASERDVLFGCFRVICYVLGEPVRRCHFASEVADRGIKFLFIVWERHVFADGVGVMSVLRSVLL